MKKSFLKGASIFLASVLTVGMCSAYSVNAKAKFSLPKKTTLSYDKKDNGGNGFYTNVIYIKGTNRSNSESILRNDLSKDRIPVRGRGGIVSVPLWDANT